MCNIHNMSKRGRLLRKVASGRAEEWVSMVDDPDWETTNDYVEVYVELLDSTKKPLTRNVPLSDVGDLLRHVSVALNQDPNLWPVGDWESLGNGTFAIHGVVNANLSAQCATQLNNTIWKDYILRTGILVRHWS